MIQDGRILFRARYCGIREGGASVVLERIGVLAFGRPRLERNKS